VRLLREVKYFLLLGLEVPATALEIYKKAETFRRQTGNLDLIVAMHNQVRPPRVGLSYSLRPFPPLQCPLLYPPPPNQCSATRR
jgi:hypothetical protein